MRRQSLYLIIYSWKGMHDSSLLNYRVGNDLGFFDQASVFRSSYQPPDLCFPFSFFSITNA